MAQEAGRQAKNLVGELGDDLRTQAGAQQQKVAEGLRSIGDELRGMADNNTQEAGTATRWVHEAARRAGDAAGWLDERDPGSLVDEVKRFARRRPGMFLAVAAGAGLLAGRMTRGLAGGSNDQDTGYGSRTGTTLPPAPRVAPPEAIKVPPTAEYHLTSGYPAGAGTPGTADAGLYESSASLETFADDDATIGYDPASGGVPPTVYPPLPEGPDGTEGRLP
ncbi:hypothetical protein [Arthrobacter sp. A5]|uniref:hypothetical protein n=1 Tax=Arthrobacter sp. A5 TaxID=576926 RepID=UPI003DA7FE33